MKHKSFTRKIFFLICLSALVTEITAQSDLEQGLKFLDENKPEQAIPIFYKETKKQNGNPKAYLYLGVACIQSGKYLDAITWLTTGKDNDYTDKYLYSYNLGNAYFMQNLLDKAYMSYSEAINQNINYAAAFFNRANTEIKLEKFSEALTDYKTYLRLKPNSPQKQAVQSMINLLEKKEGEAELARLAAEAKKMADEKRKQDLLNNVNNSLTSVDDAESVSAGSEDTIDYSEEEGNLE